MTSQTKRENLVKEIKQIRKDIKRKHRALTDSAITEQEELEKQFEPISQPLKKLVNLHDLLEGTDVKMDDIETRLKKAKRRRETVEDEEEEEEIIPNKSRKIGSIPEEPEMNTDEGQIITYETQPTVQELISTPQGRSRASFYIDKSFTGRLVKLYLRKLINDKNKEIDHVYGVYFRGNDNTLMIGNSPIQFDNDDIIINGTKYEGTPGLYELIFMRIPDSFIYSEEDLNVYAAILKSTNAHKHLDRIKSNKGYKYINIIKKLFSNEPVSKSRRGSGLLTLNNNKPDYVYWDDPNELCDRLRLLIASQTAGHTGHENEIISIIEELREAKIIN